ncbi:hypothetical protein MTBUT4_570007 [Magnetospirillum sp. UT-4]|nr:hypothetical protein MTBUT4_570007 [Magnetospirillum sp. UT-4]
MMQLQHGDVGRVGRDVAELGGVLAVQRPGIVLGQAAARLAVLVFQVHGVDADGAVVVRRQLRRAELLKVFCKILPCLVGLEACATSHYWPRQIAALGHEVRLLPPAHVKPYLKLGKKPVRLVTVALANKMARIARPVMTSGKVEARDDHTIVAELVQPDGKVSRTLTFDRLTCRPSKAQ